MHLFDEEMYSTLDAIEFLMHMPRNIFDLYDIDEHLLSASHDTPHHIILMPDMLLAQVRLTGVTMILLADDCSRETKQVCDKFCPTIGVHYVKDLTTSLLETLWINLYEQNKSHKYPDLQLWCSEGNFTKPSRRRLSAGDRHSLTDHSHATFFVIAFPYS